MEMFRTFFQAYLFWPDQVDSWPGFLFDGSDSHGL